VAILLKTLGGLHVRRDAVEMERLTGQRLRAALLIYMAVERCTSREALLALFWPESTSAAGRHALRQSLYHLRRELDTEFFELRTHELCISDVVTADVHDFTTALEAGDFETAARLYEGPFLHGVHLVDLQPWEAWVDAQRAHYARLFRRACREWVDARRAAGDVRGAVDAAQHWLAPDPFDDEAQHALIATLADAGERTAAIRQYEVYARLLAAESLEPLDETVALMERVRSDAPRAAAAVATADVADSGAPTSTNEDYATRRGPRRGILAVAIVLLLVLATWGVIRISDAASLSSADVAVLPFAVRGGADMQYLSEGVVALLVGALDGTSLRPVDARAALALAAQNGRSPPDVEVGRRLATRLNAGLYVLGDVMHAGDQLHIEAVVYRSEGTTQPVARARVSGDAQRLFELVDGLAVQLLAGIGATDRLSRTAAVATRSLEAFKAYMEGDAALRAGRFELAADAYLRAVAIDSAYAVAYYRLALARDWAAVGGYDEAARAAARHADRLTPRDRALLEALQAYHAGSAPEAERRYRTILSRYPDDVEAWAQLGEVLFHYGPLRGRPLAEAEVAWREVLRYEPRNRWALVHLARIAAVQRDVETLDALVARFPAEEVAADRRLVQVALLRALAARDSAAALRLAQGVKGWEDPAVYQLAGYLTAYSDDPAGARAVVRALMEPYRGAGMRADMHWFIALLHAADGNVEAMRSAYDSAASLAATLPSRWHGETFALVNAWWLATLPLPYADSTIQRMRASALAAELPREPSGAADSGVGDEIWLALARETLAGGDRLEALRHYTVGLLSLRLKDRTQAAASARALSTLASSGRSDWFVRDCDRGLLAFIARADGRAEDALRILDTLEFGPELIGATNIVPFVARAHERRLRGELLRSLGRETEAQAWFASLASLSVPETAYRRLR
jgi:DNA-binding SARP family transcriptional activator